MANRLSKIVTHTGDDGTTGLGDGSRLPKDSARIEAIGAVDELNSALGVLLTLELPDTPATRDWLLDVQHRLFDLGGELAVPGMVLVTPERVAVLEQRIQELNAELPPLKEFVLPGGTPAAAACHLARAICRRAERRCWTLQRTQPDAGTTAPLQYLNRLSDLLFVLARVYARARGGSEVLWQHQR
jgi:cob(I)alamin adenosyltransferase